MSKLDEMMKRAGNRENGYCPKCGKETQQLITHHRYGGLLSDIHTFYSVCQRCGYKQQLTEIKV